MASPLLSIATLAWGLSEAVLVVMSRANRRGAQSRDKGSMALFWIVIFLGIASGAAVSHIPATRIAWPFPWLTGVCLFLLTVGAAIRWTAILTLGRFFSTQVAIHADHRLVRTGLFRLVRHPSYTGLLFSFLALGLAFGNWLSVAAVGGPFVAALVYRIRIEEASLVEALGDEYREYRRSTRALVPGVF